MKKKTLSQYIIRKYASFLIVLALLVSVIYNAVSLFLFGTDMLNTRAILDAATLISSDYENTDISLLDDIGGWIEILDENNQVIYTKGTVPEPKDSYTQSELLTQNALGSLLRADSFTVAGVINITYKGDPANRQKYAATYTAFERDGKPLTGIVKFPAENVSAGITFINPRGELAARWHLTALVLAASVILLLLACLLRYSHVIRVHLAAPNARLVEGLREITAGNYSCHLELNAEYEYREIEDSFNLLADELRQATEERDRLNRERQHLLSSIAHDLKTPITTIQGCARALADHMVSSPEQQEEYLEAICRKSAHMTELVNKLLEYSRLENDSFRLTLQETDFAELARSCVIDCYDAFEKNEMTLDVDIPDAEILLNIDPTETRRVLLNLLNNSIVHNPPGTKVHIRTKKVENWCIFEVRDNGTPIPPGIQDSIFEPFVCGDRSRQTRNGSGLGLSICRTVAGKHGGDVFLREEKEGEKSFVLRLPL